MEERQIGEVFEFEGMKLKVEKEKEPCVDCYFSNEGNCKLFVSGKQNFCAWFERNDETNIIFKEVKED